MDVYRSDSVVNSTCAITNTRYSYILPPDSVCHIYDFTVTPVNVVGRGQINSATYSPRKELLWHINWLWVQAIRICLLPRS